jgi:hypothetical protein
LSGSGLSIVTPFSYVPLGVVPDAPIARASDTLSRAAAASRSHAGPVRRSESGSARIIEYGDSTMKMRTATLDAAAAVNLLKHARSVCDQLNPLGTPMTMAELQQRAQIVDSVIRARAKLQLLRNRAVALEDAVTRFKARKNGKAA